MPSASVTVKIASISFSVTTSSIDADLARALPDLSPRLVVEGDAPRSTLAQRPLLGLAREQYLLRPRGERADLTNAQSSAT